MKRLLWCLWWFCLSAVAADTDWYVVDEPFAAKTSFANTLYKVERTSTSLAGGWYSHLTLTLSDSSHWIPVLTSHPSGVVLVGRKSRTGGVFQIGKSLPLLRYSDWVTPFSADAFLVYRGVIGLYVVSLDGVTPARELNFSLPDGQLARILEGAAGARIDEKTLLLFHPTKSDGKLYLSQFDPDALVVNSVVTINIGNGKRVHSVFPGPGGKTAWVGYEDPGHKTDNYQYIAFDRPGTFLDRPATSASWGSLVATSVNAWDELFLRSNGYPHFLAPAGKALTDVAITGLVFPTRHSGQIVSYYHLPAAAHWLRPAPVAPAPRSMWARAILRSMQARYRSFHQTTQVPEALGRFWLAQVLKDDPDLMDFWKTVFDHPETAAEMERRFGLINDGGLASSPTSSVQVISLTELAEFLAVKVKGDCLPALTAP